MRGTRPGRGVPPRPLLPATRSAGRRPARAALAVVGVVAALVPVGALVGAGPAGATTAKPDLASLVDPFVGTGSGGTVVGTVDTFPGADVPFGMVQWSPDTAPNRTNSGGYDYTDNQITGFSLTHLSGAGCAIFGDVPVLPTTGALGGTPENLTEPFSHADEHASPGRYQVALGTPSTDVQLSVTARSGIGQFTFPATTAANLLFKVSDSANGIQASSVQVVGTHEVEGTVTSGNFCTSKLEHYTVHFFAAFSQPFTAQGTWTTGGLSAGSSSCSGTSATACGAWVTFDTTTTRTVTMKVGISYVSVANARANLDAEDPGWSLDQVASRATDEWNAMLGRIDIKGGTETQRETFYTALYHSLLDPTTFSDVNGEYMGFDGKVHRAHGSVQYANFSEWDIYRSEIPLLAMIDPSATSDMVQSLLDDASQNGGWLPTWVVANGDGGTMNGDSADPIIAAAYAFGARHFDLHEALDDMVQGAENPATAPDGIPERPDLAEFEKLGYVPADGTDPDAPAETVGASETLEYAIDDFSIAQLAQALGDRSVAKKMMTGAQSWQSLFNPATGYVQAKSTNGSFPTGPAMQYLPANDIAAGLYQAGFAEGNAVQYTWSVPQDLRGLFALMGGDGAVNEDLDTYFTSLNAGPWEPYDWSGNEPDMGVPWEYDYSGAPWRAQATVRSIATSEYSLTPGGEPGNDDLGAMSSWYVWAALGLYPLTPGSADLVTASPMFPAATVHLGDGKTLAVEAQGTPHVYVASATLATGSGSRQALRRPWVSSDLVHGGGTLRFALSATPDKSWGASPADAPPSYGEGSSAVGFTEPSGTAQVSPGTPTAVTLGAQSGSARPVTVRWHVVSADGVTVTPSSGELHLAGESPEGRDGRASTTVHVTGTSAGFHDVRVAWSEPGSHDPPPPVTLQVDVGS